MNAENWCNFEKHKNEEKKNIILSFTHGYMCLCWHSYLAISYNINVNLTKEMKKHYKWQKTYKHKRPTQKSISNRGWKEIIIIIMIIEKKLL